MRSSMMKLLTYLASSVIVVHHAAGFTSPAYLNGLLLAKPKVPKSPSPSSSTCSYLNAFGIRTLKRMLSPEPKGRIPTTKDISEEGVRNLFTQWNEALATGDSRKVADLYSSDPLLLPTVSDTPRTTFEGIKDYFDHFLILEPRGRILEGQVKIGNGWAQDAGIYEFELGGAAGAEDGGISNKLKARYSFVYVWEDGRWKIAHHHSSGMPESNKKATTASEAEVKRLFRSWNDALRTGDPAAVAGRYSEDAVLLPFASDAPRSDRGGIEEYFASFLELEPSCDMLESYITCGDGWCKDVGIYELTLGTTGEKARVRYSFVYVFEGGGWKISHHHSSKMPEAPAPPPAARRMSEDEVRSLSVVPEEEGTFLEASAASRLRRRMENGRFAMPPGGAEMNAPNATHALSS